MNVRSGPNGAILGALHDGAVVAPVDSATDARGRTWSSVEPAGSGKAGWVFGDLASCP